MKERNKRETKNAGEKGRVDQEKNIL